MVTTSADGQACDLADAVVTVHLHGSRAVLMAHSPGYPPVVVRTDDTWRAAEVQSHLHEVIRRMTDTPRRDGR